MDTTGGVKFNGISLQNVISLTKSFVVKKLYPSKLSVALKGKINSTVATEVEYSSGTNSVALYDSDNSNNM